MKAFINRILTGLLLLIVFSCQDKLFVEDLAGFDPNSNLPLYEITLTNPGQNAAMTYLDLGSGEIYNYTDATKHPEKIDFIYLWGTSSGANLVSPDNIARLNEWGSGQNVNANWFIKNKTTFIRLAKEAVPTDFYSNVHSMADVKNAYASLKVLVEAQPDYNPTLHGEGNQLRNIQVGDLLGIKTSKQVYAIAKVQSLATGNAGSISLAIKADKSAEVQVEPIAPSEVYSSFDIDMDMLEDLTGKSLLDLSDGTGYTVTEGYYNQSVIDAVFYHDGQDMTVSAPSQDIPMLNEDVIEIQGDWTRRIETKFIRLKASTETDTKWNRTYKNSQIKELFNTSKAVVEGYDDYAVDLYGPANSVKGIQTGDVILYFSEDRNIYGMIRVTDSGPDFLKAQAKVNIYDKGELVPPVLHEFTSTGAGSSTAAYVDFKTGNVYTTEAEGEANVADIDIISVRGSSSGNNLFPTTSDATAGAWYASWGTRMATWPNRNAAEIYGYLGDTTPAHWWELYHDLKEDQTMWDDFQTATAGVTPVQRLRETSVSTGPKFNKTVIFIHCLDRKLLVALKVKERLAESITYRYKIIELE
ncbi:hypothetical protein G5B30_05160 [Sphingobacterium sp. SGG-5]|uniref:hypothetical protein n=1 Tax=Sphingobacterium sp. SGG-5 TaxID=2710881 RepID=UPI0013EBF1A3|nr:hypothetical protein [Sphingobacterium sp. SGG-5]NGM61304.1 hypothetical protein [Sphingobacterium sp. SGG-5]